MFSLTKHDIKVAIKTFYGLNHSKGKLYVLEHFRDAVKQGLISKSQIYRLLEKLENEGNIDRKPGSKRPSKLTETDLKKLHKIVNNKTGQSQNKPGNIVINKLFSKNPLRIEFF